MKPPSAEPTRPVAVARSSRGTNGPVKADDAELVRRMLDGDERAFERFSDQFIPALYRFAAQRLRGDPELTREIVQSTVCKVVAKLPSFRGEASLMTWMCACCRFEIASHFRRRKRAPREVEWVDEAVPSSELADRAAAPDGPERAAIRKEADHLVHMALDLLPTHHGRALEWKYIEGASVQQIARRLKLGAKATESLLARARFGFRKQYDQLGAELAAGDRQPRGPSAAREES